MAWDGSGTFNRIYSWVADAVAGTKIRADRMDTEFANYKAGLENCLTKDNQVKPTVDTDWNAKKITNLADPFNYQDAVTLNQAYRMHSQWQFVPAVTPVYVSASSYKFVGIDLTAQHIVGRRIRVFDSSGTAKYGFITASAYTTDTLVTFSGNALVAGTMTFAWVGLDEYTNPATAYRGVIKLRKSANTVLGGAAYLTTFTSVRDVLSQWDGTNKYTAVIPGDYLVTINLALSLSSATNDTVIDVVQNNTTNLERFSAQNLAASVSDVRLQGSTLVTLAAADYLQFSGSGTNSTIVGSASYAASSISIVRVN